ncbi:MAG: methyltransferase [Paludibacter sp.]|nr:methyltransferase [Paludibacter sp.]
MSNTWFRFKQFTVFHHLCAMKVGIDGVLLGIWASVENPQSVLDIGTGTGLIALMIAQRSNAKIDAIDIDENAVLQAKENVSNSPWPDRIHVSETSLQNLAKNPVRLYDLIVSNPPFFINSTKTPTGNRTLARHTDSLSHEELIENATLLLKPTGRICIILPVNVGLHCIAFAVKKGLYCSKQCTVYPKPQASGKRLLLEFRKQQTEKEVSELVIETNERYQYSPAFTELAKEFYLKL